MESRSTIRRLLNNILITDSDFDAFCLDHFSDVYARFGNQMDRIAKMNLLLQCHEKTIVEKLESDHAEQVIQFRNKTTVQDPGFSAISDELKSRISQGAYEIISKRPNGWNLLLLAKVLSDELAKLSDLRRDFDLGLSAVQGIVVNDFFEWSEMQFCTLARFIADITVLTERFSPSELEEIIYFGKKLSAYYAAAIEWSVLWRSIHLPDEYVKLAQLSAESARWIVSAIEKLNIRIQQQSIAYQTNELIHALPIDLELRFEYPDLEPINAELRRITCNAVSPLACSASE